MAKDDDAELDSVMPNDYEEDGKEEIEILLSDDVAGDEEIPGAGKGHDEGARPEDLGGKIDDDELDADDSRLSHNVQDRIRRERRLRKRQVETERNMRLTAEATAEKERTDRLQSNLITYTVLGNAIQERIAGLTERMVKAKEAGQTNEEVDLQNRLNTEQSNLREATEYRQRIEQEQKTPRAPQNQEANKWLTGNRWYSDPEFLVEASGVKILDQQLTASRRFDPRSPEFFAELDRRITDKFPSLHKKARESGLIDTGDDVAPATRRQASRQPVSGVPQRQNSSLLTPRTLRSRSSVTLTKTDFDNMRKFKMDPQNKAHVQAYAREKLAMREG